MLTLVMKMQHVLTLLARTLVPASQVSLVMDFIVKVMILRTSLFLSSITSRPCIVLQILMNVSQVPVIPMPHALILGALFCVSVSMDSQEMDLLVLVS